MRVSPILQLNGSLCFSPGPFFDVVDDLVTNGVAVESGRAASHEFTRGQVSPRRHPPPIFRRLIILVALTLAVDVGIEAYRVYDAASSGGRPAFHSHPLFFIALARVARLVVWCLVLAFRDPRPGVLGVLGFVLTAAEGGSELLTADSVQDVGEVLRLLGVDEPTSPAERWSPWPPAHTYLFLVMLCAFLIRLLAFASMTVLSVFQSIFVAAPPPEEPPRRRQAATASGQPLAAGSGEPSTASLNQGGEGTPAASRGERYKPPSSFTEFYRHSRRLLPFIWPSGRENRKLQMMVIMCMTMLVAGRVINVLVPYQYKRVIDSLAQFSVLQSLAAVEGWLKPYGVGLMLARLDGNGTMAQGIGNATEGVDGDAWNLWFSKPKNGYTKIPWGELIMFVMLRFLQGSGGLVSVVQNYCWIPVGQFTTREVSIAMFNHLHRLSHRFHMSRKTGEILRVQDRGVASIVSILSSVLFNIVPCLVDIVVSVVYFTILFDIYFGLIVFVTMALYITVTIIITEWRTGYRRAANNLDNAMEARAVDSLLNFETVKLYTAEAFEEKMYKTAVADYQAADFASSMSLSALNMSQTTIIQLGLLAGCLLCAKRIVVDGTMKLGDFVLYYTYITQLYGPLNWFGTYYRVIQKNFVDMEKMLDLFEEEVEVEDVERAPPLNVRGGELVFENVTFGYDPRIPPILQDVSFKVPAGATVALVGPSGGGKSTVFRLILRFYDLKIGRILIDGQDIRTVQQKSLRGAIGVVPQDTVLFNESIMYNILYGRPEGTADEVVDAAVAAQIHDRILSFPDEYETKVGERGLRLSGGEKQRVAIARTLLKNPAIVLLDEATSALDNTTERMVQESLRTLCDRRTTLVIAHRLSTVVDADLILVMKGGRVVERGTHEELLRVPEGEYLRMWLRQLSQDKKGAAAMQTTPTVAPGSVEEVVVEEDEGVPKKVGQEKTPKKGNSAANRSCYCCHCWYCNEIQLNKHGRRGDVTLIDPYTNETWIVLQHVLTAIQSHLLSTTTATVFAQAIDAVYPSHRPADMDDPNVAKEEPESFLLQLWEAFANVAQQIPVGDRAMVGLVEGVGGFVEGGGEGGGGEVEGVEDV
ncbi:ATP-binding cassette sub- B member 6, mitochondrial [Phlyctochytrium bullatum]|nr:ATP-binding cassette sub- B member 6, mitochondrial [Phlyctochytrium bullatum]